MAQKSAGRVTVARDSIGPDMFHADLHIHSKFSRACSRDCDIEHLSWWALRKGLRVLGTGDFTHPAWAAELKDTLVPAEPGLFRVRPDLERRLMRDVPASCAGTVRFLLSVEISTIYRRDERTRKVHHLLYAPSFEAAGRITEALAKIGNLASDGRPILGLDSRDLLEITLSGGPGCFLVPAHVWTPWFAVLGSKSGFDAVRDCYADLADQIFAVETGLSSDPAMNWTCSSLDGYRLVSNSDAHSPPMLGREATVFGTELDYFAMAEALRTGRGLDGTVEFFPEEGKYHLDGHRKCGVRMEPEQTRALDARCPQCGKPLTVGVLHRVAELADRPAGYRPEGAAGFTSLVQLPEIVGELLATGPKSKKVTGEVTRLVAALGPELGILREVPLDDVRRAGGSLLGEAIARLRRSEVIADAGYDGEYGTIRLFRPEDLDGAALFAVPSRPGAGQQHREPGGAAAPAAMSGRRPRADRRPGEPDTGAAAGDASGGPEAGAAAWLAGGSGTGSVLDGLDAEQRAAATAAGPLLIIAGPGTGKTRTLTSRIASQILEGGRPAGQFLAITFTRRAAQEMQDRLAALGAGGGHGEVTVTTFHGLGLRILREFHAEAGLPARLEVADEATGLAGGGRASWIRARRPPAGGRPGRPAGPAAGTAPPGPGRLRRPGRAGRGAAGRNAGGGGAAAGAMAVRQRGRIPGHRRDAVRAAPGHQRRRGRTDRDRRPGPGHLRVPRGGRRHLRPVRRRLPGGPHGRADDQLPFPPGDRRRGHAGHLTRHAGARAGWPGRPGRPSAEHRRPGRSASTRRRTRRRRRRGSRPRSTSCWAGRPSTAWTAAGPTGTGTASWDWPTSPCCTGQTHRPARSGRR